MFIRVVYEGDLFMSGYHTELKGGYPMLVQLPTKTKALKEEFHLVLFTWKVI